MLPEILDLPDAYRFAHFGCIGRAEKDQLYSITFITVFFTEQYMCTLEVKCSSQAKMGYLKPASQNIYFCETEADLC